MGVGATVAAGRVGMPEFPVILHLLRMFSVVSHEDLQRKISRENLWGKMINDVLTPASYKFNDKRNNTIESASVKTDFYRGCKMFNNVM